MEYFDHFKAQVLENNRWRITAISDANQVQIDDIRLFTAFWDLMEDLKTGELGLLHYDSNRIALYEKEEDGNLKLLSEDVSVKS